MSKFDLQPRLVGERVVLRPLEPADWGALYGAASDREIWASHPAHDRWTEPVFRQFFADALESGGALVATLPGDDTIIGTSRYDARRVILASSRSAGRSSRVPTGAPARTRR